MVLITIVTGANLNQLITGGPHLVVVCCDRSRNFQFHGDQAKQAVFTTSQWEFQDPKMEVR